MPKIPIPLQQMDPQQILEKIKSITKFMIDGVINDIDQNNTAFQIYNNMYKDLLKYKSMDQYFSENQVVKWCMDKLVETVKLDPVYQNNEGMDKRKRGWNLLGDELTTTLSPRFSKQKPSDPNKSREQQTLEWMNENAGLDIEKDKIMVTAGFLSIHYV